MRFSVVINTYNRAASLRQTLRSLRHQAYADFEVIVVNGPSTDATAAVLAEFAGAVRVGQCPQAHLSRSRNAGIALASGDVVAFLDDDAVPDPHWLEDLAAAYTGARVGGAGGIVHDHTGFRLQYRYATCDRTGSPSFDAQPPFEKFNVPGADPFVYLQGTNASFRRACLAEVGGFDEEIEYYLDEVEVCLRILDRGFTLRPLPNAAVHHKYLASHLRTGAKVVLNPYPLVKNRCYFALQNGRRTRPLHQLNRALVAFADALRANCENHFAEGRMDAEQRRFFLEQLERGLRDGTERGLHGIRRRCVLPPPDASRFRPFPVLRPQGKRRTVCFLCPAPLAGTDGAVRAACPDGAELAALGHEVHVVGPSPDTNRVDFEDGVWVHRLVPSARHVPELRHLPWRAALLQGAAFYREVERIHDRGAIDLLVAPSAAVGAVCALDERFAPLLDARGVCGAHEELPLPPLEELRSRTASQGGAAIAVLLAGVLAEAVQMSAAEARAAAVTLLDPACYPTDYAGAVLALWPGPDEDFVRGLFRLLLEREADPASLAAYLRQLRWGMPRHAVVKHVALSREAADKGLPRFWLPAVRRAGARAATPRAPARLLDRARTLATRLAWALKRRLRRAG